MNSPTKAPNTIHGRPVPGRGLRRLCIWAGTSSFIVTMVAFLLFFLVSPPRNGSPVTGIQKVCLSVMIFPSLVFSICLVLSIIGVIIPSTRKQMYLPLLLNLGVYAAYLASVPVLLHYQT